MPIGKDSIQKRVAKNTETAKEETPLANIDTVDTKKSAAKKTSAANSATAGSSTKKVPASTPSQKKSTRKPLNKVPTTSVIGNISSEVVEKVTGHKEINKVERISITEKLPVHLL